MSSLPDSPVIGPVPRSTLSAEVRIRLSAAILSRELAPGSRLVEAHLARELGVSRAPVREALQQLQQTGLVVVGQNGYQVPMFAIADLRELVQLRVALERMAIRLVVRSGGDAADVLAEVTASMYDVESVALADPDALSRLDTEFHRCLCELSGNGRLLRVWDEMATQISLAIVATNLSFQQQRGFAAEHERLTDLIRDGDARSCEVAIEEHIGSGLRHYEEVERQRDRADDDERSLQST